MTTSELLITRLEPNSRQDDNISAAYAQFHGIEMARSALSCEVPLDV